MVPWLFSSRVTTAGTSQSTPMPAISWGTRGPSSSTCSVEDVAVDPEAQTNYTEMRRTGSRTGTTTLRRSDGTELEMCFRASHSTVGGMRVYIGICWPAE